MNVTNINSLFRNICVKYPVKQTMQCVDLILIILNIVKSAVF